MPLVPLTTRSGASAASLWSLDPGMHHLNHGSFGGVPRHVQDLQASLREQMESNPVRWFVELPGRIAESRATLAPLLGVAEQDLAFVPNASAGCSVVFRALEGRGPVNVTVTSHGYGAVVMGAQRLAERTGGVFTTVDLPLDATAEQCVAMVSEHLAAHPTDLLVIDQITSASSRELPAGEICDVAHGHGALVLVDGAHAPGVLDNPVETRADVWVGNLHKFWCAPRGTAVLVRNNRDLDLFPLIDSWGSPDPFPRRFDTQGTLDLTNWLCAAETFDHLETMVGWTAIRSYSAALADQAEVEIGGALRTIGVLDPIPDVGQPVSCMRLFRLPGNRTWTHAEVDGLRVPFMNASNVIVSFTDIAGEGFMRISTHAYTTPADITALATTGIAALAQRAAA